ncbi:MAG: ABC transporter permease [Gammaproteobacteria bacterium]|nr:ABC transporter permease [Gammaproteobacteria bacterium]
MIFLTEVFAKWSVLKSLAMREIRQQYVGSALGIIWQLITPMVLIGVFWIVFSVGFRVKPESGVPFVVWLTAGMAAWFAFSEIVAGSANCITGNSHLVKKVVFPVQALPMVKILVAISNHLLFLSILLILLLVYGLPVTGYFIQGLYYFCCMIILGLGVGWMVAALNVFSRDTARLVGVMLQVGMWATPILWDIKILPQPYQYLFSLNPMHYVIQGYRDSFLYAVPFTDRLIETAIFWVMTIVILMLGVFVFKRLRPQFPDLV